MTSAATSAATAGPACAVPAAALRASSPRGSPSSSYRLQVMKPESPLHLRCALHAAGLAHPTATPAVIPHTVTPMSTVSTTGALGIVAPGVLSSPAALGSARGLSACTIAAVPAFPAAQGVGPSIVTVR